MNITVEIPNYITHVVLSQARRTKYYKRGDKLPKRYRNFRFNNKGILIDPNSNPVIANPRSAGTPRLKKISGQEFYKGNVHPQTRAKIIKEMKASFLPYFKKIAPFPNTCIPAHVILDIYGFSLHEKTDLDNMSWIYMKVLMDVLVMAEIIPDDNLKYINQTQVRFFPVADEEHRKIVVHLTKSNIAA